MSTQRSQSIYASVTVRLFAFRPDLMVSLGVQMVFAAGFGVAVVLHKKYHGLLLLLFCAAFRNGFDLAVCLQLLLMRAAQTKK